MLGAIVGDIAGSRFEFNNTSDYDFELFSRDCSFTDDTLCTVAVADAILRCQPYGDTVHKWCRRYPQPMGGYGCRFAAWVESNDPQPYGSYGNGSAMRVSPVAWAYDDLEKVRAEAAATAAVTHSHPQGILGAQAVAHVIWYLRQTHNLHGVADIAREYYPNYDRLKFVWGRFDETCQGTVPLCFRLLSQSASFEDAIRRAVSWGGDSDTLGAIVGSMAEALWGVPKSISTHALQYLPDEMLEVVTEFNKRYIL